jgi:phage-related baseplate assembly protein
MAIAITDLVKDIEREDVLADMLTVAATLGLSTTSWVPGEPVWVLLTTIADQLAKLWNTVIVRANRAGFLDYASGDWLTLLAWTVYDVYRKEATFATGPITVQNRGGGFYNLIGGEIRVANSTGQTFKNVTGGTLSPWTGGAAPFPTLTLTFQADEAGSTSSTPIGGIQAYPNAPTTAPAGIYALANAVPLIGGAVEEDDALKARCRLSTGPLSPAGAKSAYSSVALSTKRSDGTSIDCTRVKVIDTGGGTLAVWLASAKGATPGTVLFTDTDVYLANVALQDKVVPAGISAYVNGALEVLVAVDITVYVDRASNVTAAEAIASAGAAVSLYFSKLPIGGYTVVPGAANGYVFRESLVAVATKSNPGIYRADVVIDGGVGSGNAPLASGEVAVPIITVAAIVVTQ